MAVNVISRLKIKNGANEPIAEGPDIAASCAVVANTTARDAILTNVKGSSYLVYRVDLPGFEYWNGSTWTAAGGSGSGSAGIPFTFDSSTTDADPGAGEFRLNNASPDTATEIYLDDVDANGTNRRTLIASFDDMIGSVKGYLTLQDANDDDTWIVYSVGGYTSATGYGKLTGLVAIDASDTFAAFSGEVLISFDAVGLPANLSNQPVAGVRSIRYNGVVDNGNSGAADTIDLGAGDYQQSTLTGNATLTLTAPPAPCGGVLVLIQDATGSRTVAFSGASFTSESPYANPTPLSRTFIPWYFDGTTIWLSAQPGPPPGVALGNANATITVAGGVQYVLPPNTLSGSAKTVELDDAGAVAGEIVEVVVYAQAQDFHWRNGGPLLNIMHTVPAGQKWTLHAKFNGTDWVEAGKMRK